MFQGEIERWRQIVARVLETGWTVSAGWTKEGDQREFVDLARRMCVSNPISFPQIQQAPIYLSLVEAVHLAKDFNAVCESDFPSRATAEYLNRVNCSGEAADVQRRKNMIIATKYN